MGRREHFPRFNSQAADSIKINRLHQGSLWPGQCRFRFRGEPIPIDLGDGQRREAFLKARGGAQPKQLLVAGLIRSLRRDHIHSWKSADTAEAPLAPSCQREKVHCVPCVSGSVLSRRSIQSKICWNRDIGDEALDIATCREDRVYNSRVVHLAETLTNFAGQVVGDSIAGSKMVPMANFPPSSPSVPFEVGQRMRGSELHAVSQFPSPHQITPFSNQMPCALNFSNTRMPENPTSYLPCWILVNDGSMA